MTPCRSIAFLAASVAIALSHVSAAAQDPTDRPTIGLVLSGGGARGLAHVGVLEVLEELRVPVDLIAGTSMGAIVGGLYASGLPSDSLRALFIGAEWETILSDRPPRSALDFNHRARQHRYTVDIGVGLSGKGPVLPRGLIAGQELGLLLRRATLPVASVDQFDRLPIPFSAVATDIRRFERVVLRQGDLVEAMRASMAIQIAITPVEIGDRLLVDGGLVDDLPVELARDMGADVIIAVDVTPKLLEPSDVRDLVDIGQQALRGLALQGVERQLASADVGVVPKLDDIDVFDFRRTDEIIELGETAARSSSAALKQWSLSEAAYDAYRASIRERRPSVPTSLSGVRIDAPKWFDERIALTRVDPRLFDTFTPELGEDAARRAHAMGELERVGYDLAPTADATELVLDIQEKPHGPHLLVSGIDLVLDSAREAPPHLTFDGVAAYVRTRIGARAAEWRIETEVGTTTGIGTVFRQPLDFAGRWFVEPSVRADRIERKVYMDQVSDAEYETRRATVGLDVGRTVGLSGELRIGIRAGRESSEADPSSTGLEVRFPDEAETTAELRASVVVDRLDAVGIPRRGLYAGLTTRASREELGADRTWAKASLDTRAYGSRGRNTLFVRAAAGGSTPAERLPVREEFLLGGFGSLGGLGDGELRGEAFAVTRVGWLVRVAELPPSFRAVVAGGWVDAGDVWDPSLDEDPAARGAMTIALGLDLPLGPLFLACTRARNGGRVTFSIGRSP
ncbi:MAG TPA: patatin-like phospholipase family protein [Gemmatimonadota bacterium]|nr:patatin-like phospholipase family protein [Gemmatimonadota bacterium]